MPLRCALSPTGRPLWGRAALRNGIRNSWPQGCFTTRNWDIAGLTLKKPVRGRRLGVGAFNIASERAFSANKAIKLLKYLTLSIFCDVQSLNLDK